MPMEFGFFMRGQYPASADMQETFASLNEINSMSPKLTAEPLRRNVNQVADDPYLAMYIALDYYYNYLLDLESE